MKHVLIKDVETTFYPRLDELATPKVISVIKQSFDVHRLGIDFCAYRKSYCIHPKRGLLGIAYPLITGNARPIKRDKQSSDSRVFYMFNLVKPLRNQRATYK